MTHEEAEPLYLAIELLRDALPVLAFAAPATAPFDAAAGVFLREAFEALVRLEKPGDGTLAADAARAKDQTDVLAAWRASMAAKAATRG